MFKKDQEPTNSLVYLDLLNAYAVDFYYNYKPVMINLNEPYVWTDKVNETDCQK